MNLTPLITQLQDKAPSFKAFGDVLKFASAKKEAINTPAAFVFLLQESAQANQVIGRTLQQVKAEIGVLMVIKDLSAKRGEASNDELERLRLEIRSAILGFAHDDFAPFEFRSGQFLEADNGMVWWQDNYASSYFISD